MLDRTQALIQVPWAHLFSSSHVQSWLCLGGRGCSALTSSPWLFLNLRLVPPVFRLGLKARFRFPRQRVFRGGSSPLPNGLSCLHVEVQLILTVGVVLPAVLGLYFLGRLVVFQPCHRLHSGAAGHAGKTRCLLLALRMGPRLRLPVPFNHKG